MLCPHDGGAAIGARALCQALRRPPARRCPLSLTAASRAAHAGEHHRAGRAPFPRPVPLRLPLRPRLPVAVQPGHGAERVHAQAARRRSGQRRAEPVPLGQRALGPLQRLRGALCRGRQRRHRCHLAPGPGPPAQRRNRPGRRRQQPGRCGLVAPLLLQGRDGRDLPGRQQQRLCGRRALLPRQRPHMGHAQPPAHRLRRPPGLSRLPRRLLLPHHAPRRAAPGQRRRNRPRGGARPPHAGRVNRRPPAVARQARRAQRRALWPRHVRRGGSPARRLALRQHLGGGDAPGQPQLHAQAVQGTEHHGRGSHGGPAHQRWPADLSGSRIHESSRRPGVIVRSGGAWGLHMPQ
mmetsp:Transcript_1459/g.3453  ORF Transcript_1459/g.3453 Transcript_1459/m.3453 type:complete len:350 (+) Transcript_1459:49-1098(+)